MITEISTRPLRVLMVTAAYPTAVSHRGTFLAGDVESLREHGVEVGVLHLQGRDKYLRGIALLRQELNRADPPDIIHGHYSFCAAVALCQRQRPVIASFWGTDVLPDPQADTLPNWISRNIAPWVAWRAAASLVPFTPMAERLHAPRVQVIEQGIDFRRFHPIDQSEARQQVGLSPDLDQRYVLFCANPLWRRKGFAILERAISILRGTGERTPEIIVLNGRPQAEVALYMNACDVLALPSSLESGPYVVKEAMACGMPIVATDVGDVRQVIGATLGCFIVPRTPEAFAVGIAQALRGPRRTTGPHDIAWLSQERRTRRILGVYERILRQQKEKMV